MSAEDFIGVVCVGALVISMCLLYGAALGAAF